MKKYDVVVVGGGPAGGYTAKVIASKGFNVGLIEEHSQVGVPLKCAGLVSSRVFDFLKTSKEKFVQNKIYGANIHSPSGQVLSIGGDKVHAFSIDRQLFDEAIIDEAKDEGVEVILDRKFSSGKKTSDGIVLDLKNKKIKQQFLCDLIVGADGAYSKVRDVFGFPPPIEFLKGIGAEVSNVNLDSRFVEIFLGRDVAPGFFAWVIPTNKEGTAARVGLCISDNVDFSAKHYFSNLFKNKYVSPLLGDAEIVRYTGGSIPLGLLKKTVGSNVMLVGDAAAQVKPVSGGGVYTGLLCASHCSSVAVEALESNNFDGVFLRKYHKLWNEDIGRELSLGMRFRRVFRSFDDKRIDRYFDKLNNKKIVDVINSYGDIDYPSKLILPLLKKAPSLLKVAVHIGD